MCVNKPHLSALLRLVALTWELSFESHSSLLQTVSLYQWPSDRHGVWDQEGGWPYPCRGEEDVVPAMSPSNLHMRLWGVHVWGSGSYSGTPVMTKLQFVSGWFAKHYAFLKCGDRRQKRLCLGSNALYQGSETGWACDCWVLDLVSPSDRFWFPPRPSGLSLGSEEVLRLDVPVQCPFPWFPTSRLRFLGLTAEVCAE